MTQIIRRFLDQTRGFTPAAETVELAPLVDEALDLTLGMEARQRIQIAREVDGVAVRTDPGLVRHLLTNLVANGRRDAERRTPGGPGAQRRTRRGLAGQRHRHRHGARREAPHLRSVLHHQADGRAPGSGSPSARRSRAPCAAASTWRSEPGKGSAFTVRFPEADAHAA